MAVGDIWELTLKGRGPSAEEMVNVLHYAEVAATTGGSAVTVAQDCADVEAALFTEYIALIHEDYTYVDTSLKSISGYAAPLIGVSTSHAGQAGGRVEESGPVERCSLIAKYTGIGGRHGRGRLYVPMPTKAQYDTDGQLAAGFGGGALFDDFIAAMIARVTCTSGLVLDPCIVDREQLLSTFLTGGSLRPLVGIQRRRRFGIGS